MDTDDTSRAQHPEEGIPVELNRNLRDFGQFTFGLRKVAAWIGMIVTGLFLLGLAWDFVDPDGSEIWGTPQAIAVLIVAVCFAVGFVLAVRAVVRPDPNEALLKANHAFVITSDTLEFPGHPNGGPQSWPLSRTTTESTGGRRGRLVLRCPGFEPRRYPALYLHESPEQVQSRILAAQRALAANK